MDRSLGKEWPSQDDASGRVQRDDPYVNDKGLGAIPSAPGTEGGAHKEEHRERADSKPSERASRGRERSERKSDTSEGPGSVRREADENAHRDQGFVEGMEPGAAALLSRMPSSRNGHSSADLVQEYMRRVAADPTLRSGAAGLAVLLRGVPLSPRCIY